MDCAVEQSNIGGRFKHDSMVEYGIYDGVNSFADHSEYAWPAMEAGKL